MPENTFEESADIPVYVDIVAALARMGDRLRPTPVLNDEGLDEHLHCRVFSQCEHLQRTGSFKFRGATNAVLQLRERNHTGAVATHSSGNHGAALALAARQDGRQCHVVMPENASPIKVEAVRKFGGIVQFCRPTQAARELGLAALVEQGHVAIPPYDHADIIAGQGTACLELLRQVPDLDAVIAPIGGGGLISGSAIVARHHGVAVYGAEPLGAADTAASLAQGRRVESWQPDTIADGLRALVGVRNFTVIRHGVEQVLTVSDEEIRAAMVLFWQHTRMIIEPSSAVVIAALAAHRYGR